ncbi:MAG TPA: hypothetical protein VLF40_04855 [Candidatus Saccharimonadales bacterium]|nr:hypothetical protein [Candidatus Saccharimonadales bacterium]
MHQPSDGNPFATTPGPEQPWSVVDEVVRDNWLSFYYSRGDTSTQAHLTRLFVDTYTTWPAKKRTELLGKLGDVVTATLGIREPRPDRHVEIDDGARANQIDLQINRFQKAVRRGPLSERRRRVVSQWALQGMFDRDNLYQIKGRPGRDVTDKYTSSVREYVLDNKPARSDAYETIFTDMRARSFKYGLPLGAGMLRARWERRHRGHGQQFFPESYAWDYQNNATRLARLHNTVGYAIGRPLSFGVDLIRRPYYWLKTTLQRDTA